MSDWSDEATDDPLYADRRNFYKVEKWHSGYDLAQLNAARQDGENVVKRMNRSGGA